MPPDRAPLRAEDGGNRAWETWLLTTEVPGKASIAAMTAFLAGFAAGVGHRPGLPVSDEVFAQLASIAQDWGKPIGEVAEGAIVEGIRAWEEQDRVNREAGVTWKRIKLGGIDGD